MHFSTKTQRCEGGEKILQQFIIFKRFLDNSHLFIYLFIYSLVLEIKLTTSVFPGKCVPLSCVPDPLENVNVYPGLHIIFKSNSAGQAWWSMPVTQHEED